MNIEDLREKILEYYLQEYKEEDSLIKTIQEAKSFYLHSYGELIVCHLDDREQVLPFAVEKEETKKGMKYTRIPIPEIILNNLK